MKQPKRRQLKDYPLVRARVPIGELRVSDIREPLWHAAVDKQDKLAHIRARRAAQILEDEAIEQAIDEYVREHAEGWSQYVPPSFDDPPEAA